MRRLGFVLIARVLSPLPALAQQVDEPVSVRPDAATWHAWDALATDCPAAEFGAFVGAQGCLIVAPFCGSIQYESTDGNGNNQNLYPIKESLLRKSGPPPSEVVAKVDKEG